MFMLHCGRHTARLILFAQLTKNIKGTPLLFLGGDNGKTAEGGF